MRVRPVLLVAALLGVLVVAAGAWLLLRPVDPAGSTVPAPITVPERSPLPSLPGTPVPTPDPAPTDVVPPPPLPDDDDGPDDDGPDDDDD